MRDFLKYLCKSCPWISITDEIDRIKKCVIITRVPVNLQSGNTVLFKRLDGLNNANSPKSQMKLLNKQNVPWQQGEKTGFFLFFFEWKINEPKINPRLVA